MQRGRLYAVEQEAGAELVLDDFSLRAGGSTAVSGDSLRVAESAPIEISVDVAAAGTPPRDVRVTLVRNGTVVRAWAGPLPLRAVHREVFDGSPTFYRLDVRGPGRLLTNPIFVRRS